MDTAINFEGTLGIGELLGTNADNSIQLIKKIERGFSFRIFEKVRKEADLPAERLAVSIGISPRTLARRKKDGKLSSSESDRLVSVARLLRCSVELFDGDKKKASEWFTEPNRGLGGISPLEMAATEIGSREVENLIGRLEYGVFS